MLRCLFFSFRFLFLTCGLSLIIVTSSHRRYLKIVVHIYPFDVIASRNRPQPYVLLH